MGDDVFPELERAGDVLIHAVFAKPENSAPAIKILHHTAICVARKRIWIQNPYFIPEPDARAHEIELARWQRRSPWHKLRDKRTTSSTSCFERSGV